MENTYRAQGDGAGHSADPMPGDSFHAHLDACVQCRMHPFDLCPVGAALIVDAVQNLDKE